MKNYLLCISLFVVYATIIGLVSPALVSSNSTEGVILGLALVISLPLMLFGIIKLFNRNNKGSKS